MRIRGTKPEFWRSERIASVDWDARLVLKGLESYVDDNGVGKDDIALIVGDVFPRDMARDPRDTLAKVSEAISSLHQAGLVHRYTVDGTRLLFVSFWEEVQRIDKPGKGRLPRPDGTFAYGDSSIRESVANVPETLAPGTGEQGNRGTGEQNDSSNEESLPRKRGTTRGTRIPEPFIVSGEMRQEINDECPLLDIDAHTRRFVDYWRAQPGQKGVKVDWVATWRNWMRRAADEQGNRRLTPTQRAQVTVAAGRSVAGQQITSLDAKEITS